jgi:predicted dehydrogenase
MTNRLGVIGYGYWDPNLVRNFSTSEHFEFVAIAERSASLRSAARKAYLVVRVVDDGSELIARSDIDAVAIATPVALHFELVRDALNGRKHVLVEKPLCSAVAQADTLVTLQSGFNASSW